MKATKYYKYIKSIFCVLALAALLITASCDLTYTQDVPSATPAPALQSETNGTAVTSPDNIPEYSGSPYIAINDNIPFFKEYEVTAESFEEYSRLDSLGRCGKATACIGKDLMPTEERGSIGQIKPAGWHTVKYDFIDGKYLYNRCHLIGYQLTGENANERNLITGTRYLNVEGMLPFENMVADYIKETYNHVLYRATPVYDGDNLLASGVLLEAKSVEDDGDGILFNVYIYNVQPGVIIDYSNGESEVDKSCALNQTQESESTAAATPQTGDTPAVKIGDLSKDQWEGEYVCSVNSKIFHRFGCKYAENIHIKNALWWSERDDAIKAGFAPCGTCKP